MEVHLHKDFHSKKKVESLDKHFLEPDEFPSLDHDGRYHSHEFGDCSVEEIFLVDWEMASENEVAAAALAKKFANWHKAVEWLRSFEWVDPLDLMTVVGVE